MSAEKKLRAIVRALNEVPGYLDQVYQGVEALERVRSKGRDVYERTHWGQRGREADRLLSVPNTSEGVIELGRLCRIDYLTRKGKSRDEEIFYHHFKGVLPILCFAPDGSGLVIVRERSRYTVTSHGIEG